jgi:hypothetical protein
MHQLDQGGVGIGPEELHQPRPTGGQLDLGPVTRAAVVQGEVDAERSCLRLLQPADTVGQGVRAGALQHAQPAGRADHDGQLRRHHPTPHGGQLDRDLPADRVGEGRAQHARKYGTRAVARSVDRDLAVRQNRKVA